MSQTFTKVFASITESTVWVEPYATRIVWITMLAKADQRGCVYASIPGLAKLAAVTVDECEAALARFKAPDRYSRTPDYEGRRIENIDGGWRLLNYAKYRAMRGADDRREYQADWVRANRKEKRARNVDTASTNVDRCRQSRPVSTQAEAEADTERVDACASTLALTAPGGANSPASTRKRKRIPSPAPESIEISAAMAQWAQHELRLPEDVVDRETEKFLNRNRSEGKQYVDWVAAWRNWMLRAVDYGARRG
jgi:hypothetical protein